MVQQPIHENLFLYCVAQCSTLSYQNRHCFTEVLKTRGKHNNQATGTWEAPAVLVELFAFDCYKLQKVKGNIQPKGVGSCPVTINSG